MMAFMWQSRPRSEKINFPMATISTGWCLRVGQSGVTSVAHRMRPRLTNGCDGGRQQNGEANMFSQQIELRGHIIDSLILPKVLDEILTNGGSFTIREMKVGQQRNDPSYASIDVFGSTPEIVDDLVRRLRQH